MGEGGAAEQVFTSVSGSALTATIPLVITAPTRDKCRLSRVVELFGVAFRSGSGASGAKTRQHQDHPTLPLRDVARRPATRLR